MRAALRPRRPGSSRPMRWAVALVVLALGAAGCGQSDDRSTVRQVTQRFFSALSSGDGETACAQLSSDTRKELESQEKKDCREAITGLQVHPGTATRIQLYITNAKVDLSSGESTFLSYGQQGWRIDAVGCKVKEAKPADQPYDCEAEA
jgi:hypothetical protein